MLTKDMDRRDRDKEDKLALDEDAAERACHFLVKEVMKANGAYLDRCTFSRKYGLNLTWKINDGIANFMFCMHKPDNSGLDGIYRNSETHLLAIGKKSYAAFMDTYAKSIEAGFTCVDSLVDGKRWHYVRAPALEELIVMADMAYIEARH